MEMGAVIKICVQEAGSRSNERDAVTPCNDDLFS